MAGNSNAVERTTDGLVELQVGITGMTCATCALRIEKGVADLAGVREARVNFGTEKARLTVDPHEVRLDDLLETIADIGCRVVTDTIALRLASIPDAAAAPAIAERIRGIPGVVKARWEPVAGTFLESIPSAGPSSPMPGCTDWPRPRWRRSKRIRAAACAPGWRDTSSRS
ncbi:MAG: heavy-metal-associated domain-containing protein [Actinomycetia bacterium]|nr:heavy-metal-associated domain-containing protein [Actinomycetes bacterium]